MSKKKNGRKDSAIPKKGGKGQRICTNTSIEDVRRGDREKNGKNTKIMI